MGPRGRTRTILWVRDGSRGTVAKVTEAGRWKLSQGLLGFAKEPNTGPGWLRLASHHKAGCAV